MQSLLNVRATFHIFIYLTGCLECIIWMILVMCYHTHRCCWWAQALSFKRCAYAYPAYTHTALDQKVIRLSEKYLHEQGNRRIGEITRLWCRRFEMKIYGLKIILPAELIREATKYQKKKQKQEAWETVSINLPAIAFSNPHTKHFLHTEKKTFRKLYTRLTIRVPVLFWTNVSLIHAVWHSRMQCVTQFKNRTFRDFSMVRLCIVN